MRFLSLFAVGLIWCCAFYPLSSHAYSHDIDIAYQNIVEVYDGDTIVVNLPGQLDVFGKELKVRLRGIDTPELRSRCSTAESRDQEKSLAVKARAMVESLLAPAKNIGLRNLGRDMYFRLLADVMADEQDVAQALIDAGLARPYDGGTKAGWCEL